METENRKIRFRDLNWVVKLILILTAFDSSLFIIGFIKGVWIGLGM